MEGPGAKDIKTRSFLCQTFADLQNLMVERLSIDIMPTRPCAVRAELHCGPEGTPTTSLTCILEASVLA